MLDASRRILNLVCTAGFMIADYQLSASKRVSDPRARKYDEYSRQLKHRQQLEEELTKEQWQAQNNTQLQLAKFKFAENKKEIAVISAEMAKLRGTSFEPSYFSSTHLKAAKRLLQMCVQNKGLYIKLGQHISMLDYLVPQEYQVVLTSLLSQNPTSSWDSVCSVIREDLGADPLDLFVAIDPTPIASASLAQVHVAYGKDGNKYAGELL